MIDILVWIMLVCVASLVMVIGDFLCFFLYSQNLLQQAYVFSKQTNCGD